MPIYEYRCQDCGREANLLRSLSDISAPVCPVCGGDNLNRLVSRVSIVKSGKGRIRDLSWVDKDLARRLRKKASGKLSPNFKETLDRMESE